MASGTFLDSWWPICYATTRAGTTEWSLSWKLDR
eukprot:SAG31_NODE_1092_length_9957_cov_10.569284_3_plen_34_part_00